MNTKTILSSLATAIIAPLSAPDAVAGELSFDPSSGTVETLTMPCGTVVEYTAYRNIYYVANVEDSAYQYMNIFVPAGATEQTPIFMPNYVGGYMAAAARDLDAGDASGRAIAEGYVVVIPGARGRNAIVDIDGTPTYTGRAPKGLLDLKAAVRFLRHFDSIIPGDAEKIVTDGTSAGGAMSSLLGTTGNNPAYEEMLTTMGAAQERDDIFAAVCFCPIVDLDHADMAYEWLYACTNGVQRSLTPEQQTVSEELAALFPAYQASLALTKPDGEALTADNYRDYIKQLIIQSAQEAKDAGADLPDDIGFVYSSKQLFAAPVNGGKKSNDGAPEPREMPAELAAMLKAFKGEYIIDLDMDTYLNYIVTTIALKTPPAFDSQGVAGARPSGENEEFGDETGSSVNFTEYSLRRATGDDTAVVDATIAENVRLMNPMTMMDDDGSTVASHWYIRHGARDRDTAFPVPVNLATKLQNKGKDVNFKLPWNRPHSGDYALNELFAWIAVTTK